MLRLEKDGFATARLRVLECRCAHVRLWIRQHSSKGAHRALCARCAESWLFSTTRGSVSSED